MSEHDFMGDFLNEDVQDAATEIALWQGAALRLPLTEVQGMVASSLNGLAETLNDFNGIYLDEEQAANALLTAVAKVTRQATATAIFTLGAHQRAARSAQLN